MILDLPFDVPFERCEKCIAFDPVVTRSDYKIGDNFEVSCHTEYRCKGERFCRLREEIKTDGLS